MINNLQKHIDEWTLENKGLGKALGYPDCCIDEFCKQPPILLKNKKPTKDDIRRYKAAHINGKYTGFIPCVFHAKQITTGKITLESLIKDRNLNFPPFPHL